MWEVESPPANFFKMDLIMPLVYHVDSKLEIILEYRLLAPLQGTER